MVQWLVEDMGADPNPVDRFGRTPLEDAVRDKKMLSAKCVTAVEVGSFVCFISVDRASRLPGATPLRAHAPRGRVASRCAGSYKARPAVCFPQTLVG